MMVSPTDHAYNWEGTLRFDCHLKQVSWGGVPPPAGVEHDLISATSCSEWLQSPEADPQRGDDQLPSARNRPNHPALPNSDYVVSCIWAIATLSIPRRRERNQETKTRFKKKKNTVTSSAIYFIQENVLPLSSKGNLHLKKIKLKAQWNNMAKPNENRHLTLEKSQIQTQKQGKEENQLL